MTPWAAGMRLDLIAVVVLVPLVPHVTTPHPFMPPVFTPSALTPAVVAVIAPSPLGLGGSGERCGETGTDHSRKGEGKDNSTHLMHSV
jgi:hypothetical protein